MASRRARILGWESKRDPLLPPAAFAKRMAASFAAVCVLITVSMLIGMAGYHFLEHMAWIDAFANAAMILSGMGPLAPLQTFAGKLFAGFYALYSGLALILGTGLLLGPLLHRLMHRFHLQATDADADDKD